MKKIFLIFLISQLSTAVCTSQLTTPTVIDETGNTESIVETITIDSVWAGHPVGFCLYKFELHILPATSRKTAGGTSTVLGWDSHNFVTLGIDKEGFIHLSGNMHVNPITYFKSTKPNDITTLQQEMIMVGPNEKRCTYPHFMLTKEGELLFHYRDGASGNGNEIYNIYSCETKK